MILITAGYEIEHVPCKLLTCCSVLCNSRNRIGDITRRGVNIVQSSFAVSSLQCSVRKSFSTRKKAMAPPNWQAMPSGFRTSQAKSCEGLFMLYGLLRCKLDFLLHVFLWALLTKPHRPEVLRRVVIVIQQLPLGSEHVAHVQHGHCDQCSC